jgi:hypothetical protein
MNYKFIHRRHQHVGVINGQLWSAHARRLRVTTQCK